MAEPAAAQLRRAGATDASAIAALHAESWRRHYRGAYSDHFLDGDVETNRLELWGKRLGGRDGSSATFTAEEGSSLVGFVHVVFDDDPRFGSLVDNLHVRYDKKRAGIGGTLMAAAAGAVLDHGGGGLYLWVLEQNVDAQGFYQAIGGSRGERALVGAPDGDRSRLNGAPAKLRYSWTPAALSRLRR